MMNLVELPHDFPHQPQKDIVTKQPISKRMWLLFGYDHRKYVYTSDDVRTIWGFVKTKRGRKGSVTTTYHAPINSNKVGDVVDINNTRNYTAMQLNLNPLESAINNV